jgi:DNA repair exonuclease SbcCD ATPase subunit
MMDFFQRRVEALERELTLERERAAAAQGLLSQQEALRSEVDAQLKTLSEQLRREKGEREGEEARSHSRGRIEALEKRLDEMNATFAQLLKEAVARRDDAAASPSAAALAAELSAFRAALKDGMDGVARWRGELRELAQLVPQVQSLSERLPENERNFDESVGRRLDEFAARMTRTLEDWRRTSDQDRASLDERLEALARERVELARLWETQARTSREEQFKDRVGREAEVSRQIGELASRLSELAAGQQGAERGHDSVRQGLERVIQILTATPKAKDMVIQELEAEKAELAKALDERHDALRRFTEDRRAMEKSMGDGLVKLTVQLEEERARTRASDARAAELMGNVETLKARLADAERATADRDARLQSLGAERDELARSLVAEADKVRRAVEERRDADAAADARLAELRRRLDDEAGRRAAAEGAAADARAQMGALAEQTARSLQERDSTLAKFSDWERERQRLMDVVRKKDEMIGLLSSTFQGALKKQG